MSDQVPHRPINPLLNAVRLDANSTANSTENERERQFVELAREYVEWAGPICANRSFDRAKDEEIERIRNEVDAEVEANAPTAPDAPVDNPPPPVGSFTFPLRVPDCKETDEGKCETCGQYRHRVNVAYLSVKVEVNCHLDIDYRMKMEELPMEMRVNMFHNMSQRLRDVIQSEIDLVYTRARIGATFLNH